MGMFDYVNFKVECPKCGTTITGFQTKDRACELLTFEPEDVNDFYASCHKCRTWIAYTRPLGSATTPRAEPITEAEVLSLGFVKQVAPR